MNKEERLAAYKKSLESAWGYNDYNDWPIKFNSIMHLFLDEFTKEFLQDLEEIRNRGMTVAETAAAFGNPARLYRIINPLIYGMKRMRVNLAGQRKIVLFLLNLVKEMKYGSEFNEAGTNIILEPQKVAGIIAGKNIKNPGRDEAAAIQRFCGIMWAYTEAIFFRAHDVTKEIHGPYKDNGICRNLLIREYLNLQPVEIWGDLDFLPFHTLKIYTEYTEELDITIDSYNHLFQHKGNFIHNLVSYAVEADGREIAVGELQALVPVMHRTILSIHNWTEKADWRTLTNRYADVYWFRKKPLRDLLGRDWRVPVSVRDSIATGGINEKMRRNMTAEEIKLLIHTII